MQLLMWAAALLGFTSSVLLIYHWIVVDKRQTRFIPEVAIAILIVGVSWLGVSKFNEHIANITNMSYENGINVTTQKYIKEIDSINTKHGTILQEKQQEHTKEIEDLKTTINELSTANQEVLLAKVKEFEETFPDTKVQNIVSDKAFIVGFKDDKGKDLAKVLIGQSGWLDITTVGE